MLLEELTLTSTRISRPLLSPHYSFWQSPYETSNWLAYRRSGKISGQPRSPHRTKTLLLLSHHHLPFPLLHYMLSKTFSFLLWFLSSSDLHVSKKTAKLLLDLKLLFFLFSPFCLKLAVASPLSKLLYQASPFLLLSHRHSLKSSIPPLPLRKLTAELTLKSWSAIPVQHKNQGSLV